MTAEAPSAAVRYVVSFPEPHTHYVSVRAVMPAEARDQIEVFLPVWTPGSYLIREYARHVEGLQASDTQGRPLAVVKSRKNRWTIAARGAAEVRIEYRVYCRDMSVRTNWVEHEFALLNGAPTFLTLADGRNRPHEVQLELPASWQTTVTALPPAGAVPHSYVARDYDALVDSPILAGNPALYGFEVDGIPHRLANQGEDGIWDGARSAADARRIVEAHRALWGSLPYENYVFLNIITEAGGGLEHSNSMCVMTSRWGTSTRKAYVSWLSLISHELFHVWNIKRLRPVELGPFDYEHENHTRSLWIAEGITDYYGPLLCCRAGLITRNEYLGLSAVGTLQKTPGRLVHSAEQSSYDAWIKLYRPDENSVNTTISYYTKGAVVGWLLDARIRSASGSRKSLDDVMRLAFGRYSGERGFTTEQFKQTAEEVAGTSLGDFFRRTVESPEELDYEEALDWFGLRFQPAPPAGKPWMGMETRVDQGRLIVTKILRDTPAFQAGLNVDDEIIATGDFRVRADHWTQRLENYSSGDTVSLLIARREKLLRVSVRLNEDPGNRWHLEVRPDANAAQKQHLSEWLGPQ